jgi:hypothetical protein
MVFRLNIVGLVKDYLDILTDFTEAGMPALREICMDAPKGGFLWRRKKAI